MKQEEHNGGPMETPPEARHNRGSESIVDLVRHLATDLSSLLGKEIELGKSEVRESVTEAQTAVGAMMTGAAVTMAGLVVLLMSAVYGLSNLVEPWLAALIVGAAAFLVGYLMVHSAKKKMSANSMVPDRTLDAAHKDKETLKRTVQ